MLWILALFLSISHFPRPASSQEWCTQAICARFEGSDVIRIRSPGAFEITYTKPEGFGEEIYDLQTDPGKLHDLSGLMYENGLLWVKIREAGGYNAYHANNATGLALLESGGVRIRASHSGTHHTNGIPGVSWDELQYVQTFTVYATGEVYVDYALISPRNIPLDTFLLILKSTGEWGNYSAADARYEAQCLGQYGSDSPYAGNPLDPNSPTASPFAMVSSNGTHYYADMMLAMYHGMFNGNYWNEGYEDQDYRCSLNILSGFSTVPTGTSHLPIMMRIARDMNDPATAMKYSDAFRNPDTAFAVLHGTKVVTDPGDRDSDGFNEEDGTYPLRRQPSQNVEFVLHGNPPRENPAFKILDWSEASPQNIVVNNVTWTAGSQFRASTNGGTLILQLLGEQTQDSDVQVLPEPAQSLGLRSGLAFLGLVRGRRRRGRTTPRRS